jgi:hypothetical protein
MTELRRLRWVADDLWVAGSEMRVGGFPLEIRMTVIRRPGGGVILHSPIEIDDALADELATLGPVGDLIAPNRMHHMFMFGAMRRYPDARSWAAPGLPDKRRDLSFDEVLGDHTPPALADTLETLLFAGAPIASEVLCFHPRSRTLIVTDLVFNLQRTRSRLSEAYLRASGAWQRLAQTPVLRMLVRDRPAARHSLERAFAWEFERVIMAHGDIVEHDAKRALAAALAKLAPRLHR